MVLVQIRVPDDEATPFRIGDIIVPRGTEYCELPYVFLGLDWFAATHGWIVHPVVYSLKSGVWLSCWFFIQNCELLLPIDDSSRRGNWARLGFKHCHYDSSVKGSRR
jgi:hypothetical protein